MDLVSADKIHHHIISISHELQQNAALANDPKAITQLKHRNLLFEQNSQQV